MNRKVLNIFISAFFLFSCDVTGDNTDVAKEISIAETVIKDFRQVRVEKGRAVYEVNAKRAESFSEEQLTKIYDLVFKQFDKDEQVATEGTALQVDYNIETENATVNGEMDFHSLSEGVRLKSTWLEWENEKKTLTGKTDIPVRLEKDGGTILEGKGFKAYTDTKTVLFENGMWGIFIPEDNDDTTGEETTEEVDE